LGNAVAAASIESATSYYVKMESTLSANSWLAGSFSFADIAFYMAGLVRRASRRAHHQRYTKAIGVADSHDAATRGARGRRRHGKLAESGWTTRTGIHACAVSSLFDPTISTGAEREKK